MFVRVEGLSYQNIDKVVLDEENHSIGLGEANLDGGKSILL